MYGFNGNETPDPAMQQILDKVQALVRGTSYAGNLPGLLRALRGGTRPQGGGTDGFGNPTSPGGIGGIVGNGLADSGSSSSTGA